MVILTVFTMMFTLSGCVKKAIETDTFVQKAQAAGYTVEDMYSTVEGNRRIVEFKMAMKDDYHIEFAEVTTLAYAKVVYAGNKSKTEARNGNIPPDTKIETKNYSKYTMTANGQYYVVSQIDKTIIYCVVDVKYKDEVDSFLKSLNY